MHSAIHKCHHQFLHFLPIRSTLEWELWNRNSFEFKFDDKDFPHIIKKCFVLRPDFANFFNGINLILVLWGKSGKYHHIWIQNYFGFIVSDLFYMSLLQLGVRYQCLNIFWSFLSNFNDSARANIFDINNSK